jgi:hypothetical protein
VELVADGSGEQWIQHCGDGPACYLHGRQTYFLVNNSTIAALWNHRAGLPDLADEKPSNGKGVTDETEERACGEKR